MNIVGMTLNEVMPWSHAHMRLEPGVTVIYGKNASGKSRVLERIKLLFDPGRESTSTDGVDLASAANTGFFFDLGHQPGPLQFTGAPWFVGFSLDQLHIRWPSRSQDDLTKEDAAFLYEFSGRTRGEAFRQDIATLSKEAFRQALDNAFIGDLTAARASILADGYWSLTRFSRTAYSLHASVIPSAIEGPARALYDRAQAEWADVIERFGIPRVPFVPQALARIADLLAQEGRFIASLDEFDVLNIPPNPELIGLPPRPSWAPVPIVNLDVRIGSYGWWTMPPVLDEKGFTIEALTSGTLERLRSVASRPHERAVAGYPQHFELPWIEASSIPQSVVHGTSERINIRPDIAAEADLISQDATDLFSRLLPDSLPLRCDNSLEPNGWFATGELVQWEAYLQDREEWVGLKGLSTGQLRWALFSIAVALQAFDERTVAWWTSADGPDVSTMPLIVVDEPELALHPMAEERVVDELLHRGERIVLASHSLTQIARSHTAYHIFRNGKGGVVATNLAPPDKDNIRVWAEELGTSLGAILQSARVIVLVEGIHDEVFFDALLRHDLERSWGYIYKMQGTHGLSAVAESDLLFDVTEANFLIVLDGMQKQFVTAWSRAVDLHRAGRAEDALRALRGMAYTRDKYVPSVVKSVSWLGQRAIQHGRLDRVSVFGLAEPDVLHYVPEDALGLQEPWRDVRRHYVDYESQIDGKVTETRYKAWLRKKQIAAHEDGVRAAVRSVRSGHTLLSSDAMSMLASLGAEIRTLAGIV